MLKGYRLTMAALAASVMVAGAAGPASAQKVMRLSHQWSTSDVRHKVAEVLANHVAEAGVGLEIQIYPSKSLFKPREQYKPVSRGQLDMSIYPLAYAGGLRPEFNLTLMPGLVKNHDHAKRLNASDFIGEIKSIAKQDGVLFLLQGWLAGGFAAKDRCITSPDDVKGLQLRAAGKSFEQMLAGAGASITSMPSSEIYNAMQTGVLDGANTSSSSFVSFRIYEQVTCYTPASDFALWFMYHPLILSQASWDSLTAEQQAAMEAGAAKAEAYFFEEAKKIDANSVEVYRKNGVEIANMTQAEFDAWRAVAQRTSYKKFAEDVDGGQALLDLALSVD